MQRPYQEHTIRRYDKFRLIGKLEEAVARSKINAEYAKQIIAKIVTYFEFIQAKKQTCLLKLEQGDAEAKMISQKVLSLSCQIFLEQGI